MAPTLLLPYTILQRQRHKTSNQWLQLNHWAVFCQEFERNWMSKGAEDHIGSWKIVTYICLVRQSERILSDIHDAFLLSMQRIERVCQEDAELCLGSCSRKTLGCLNLLLFGLGDQAACLFSPRLSLEACLHGWVWRGPAWKSSTSSNKGGIPTSLSWGPCRTDTSRATQFSEKNAKNVHHFLSGMTQ